MKITNRNVSSILDDKGGRSFTLSGDRSPPSLSKLMYARRLRHEIAQIRFRHVVQNNELDDPETGPMIRCRNWRQAVVGSGSLHMRTSNQRPRKRLFLTSTQTPAFWFTLTPTYPPTLTPTQLQSPELARPSQAFHNERPVHMLTVDVNKLYATVHLGTMEQHLKTKY